ncbi:MAG: hypothetical protein LBD92_02695 [Oscillospiraceae bacterium]|jgi:uncharacterized protein YpuA (DUF1002 family)|nr:hypothetical protein [Oscillospiraceae bacterium]
MPRGVKGSGKGPGRPSQTKTTKARIAEIEELIEDYKEKISQLQKAKKELVAIKNQEDADLLLRTVLDSGLSVEQAIHAISGVK